MTLTFGSLFAGIGGFDLGLERAGMVCKWQVEKDTAARAVLSRRFPDTPKLEDVRNVSSGNVDPVDLICGGFPCQDLSVAGRRAGLAGERSGLWFEFHRIIGELKPGWVVIENVPGLLSSNGGADFAVILRGLAEWGYLSAWRILDAQYFGLAQRRRRVFIIASLGNGRSAQVLFEREGGSWNSAPGREKGARVAQSDQNGVGIAGGELGYALRSNPSHSGDKGDGGINTNFVVAFGGNNTTGPIDTATACNAHGGAGRMDFESETFVCNAFNGYTGGADDNDAQAWHIVPTLSSNGDAHSGPRDDKGLAIAATSQSGGNGNRPSSRGEHLVTAIRLAQTSSNGWGIKQDGTTGTLDQTGGDAIASTKTGVRRLTPVECERLQGFPDGHTEGQSDSARYRQLGNAVAVPVAEWIAHRIVEVEAQ